MIPYILLAAYVLFCRLLHYRGVFSRGLFLVACLVPAWVLLAFRGSSVGEDTAMYLNMASVANSLSWDALLPIWGSRIWSMDEWGFGSSVDNGYLILCKLIMGIAGDPQVVIVFCSAVICAGFGRFLYLGDEDVTQSLWCFLCGGLYMFAFNGMRQTFAMAIALLCCKPLRDGRWLRASIVVLFAALFHKSALIMLVIIAVSMLMPMRRTFSVALVVACLTPVFVSMAEPVVRIVSPQYASYFSNNYWDTSVGGIAFFWIAIAVCVILLIRGYASKKIISVCSVSYLALAVSAMYVSILERVAAYFLPFVCLLFPGAARTVAPENRWWFKLGIDFLLLFMYLSYANSPARTYMFCT